MRCLALLPLLLAGCQAPALPAPPPARQAVLVRFEPGVAPAERAALRAASGAGDVAEVFRDAERWHVADAPALLVKLAGDARVRYAQPNGRYQLEGAAAGPAPAVTGAATGDPLFEAQWNLPAAGFPAAWQRADGSGVVVAVLDSGVDPGHPDLAANLLPVIDEIAALASPDLREDPAFVDRDGNGHGTHVAGIIAAVRGNGIGVAGAAPGVKILPVKIATSDGYADDASLARGLLDALEHGAQVINMSVGGEEPAAKPILIEALDLALARGVTVVVASGNAARDHINVAARRGTIAVGGARANGEVAGYSSHGVGLSLLAPGGGQGAEGPSITSTTPTYPTYLSRTRGLALDYGELEGTSMAAPHVSAAVALLLQQEPGLAPAQVLTRVLATARPKGLLAYDERAGFGLLDAARLLAASGPEQDIN